MSGRMPRIHDRASLQSAAQARQRPAKVPLRHRGGVVVGRADCVQGARRDAVNPPPPEAGRVPHAGPHPAYDGGISTIPLPALILPGCSGVSILQSVGSRSTATLRSIPCNLGKPCTDRVCHVEAHKYLSLDTARIAPGNFCRLRKAYWKWKWGAL
jgi:hypothetical protein